MKQVKYFLLARLIKLFLQLGFLLCVLSFSFNLGVELFSKKSYLEIGGWTIGNRMPVVRIKAAMGLSIADTITYYNNGFEKSMVGEEREGKSKNRVIKEQLVNKIAYDKPKDVSISSDVRLLNNNVLIGVKSKKVIYNIFWAITAHLDLLFSAIFFLILTKLTNRYMDGEIFMCRTFKLLSFLGILLIASEIFELLIGFINMKIIGYPMLHTKSAITNKNYDNIDASFDFLSTISLTNIGIGILIILLAQVLKEAIVAKQEIELTI